LLVWQNAATGSALRGRGRHQFLFGKDARNLFAISLDVNGTRKFLNAGTLVGAAAYSKKFENSSAQNRTIAKSRGSLAGRTVLHKSSFRRAAYLFRGLKCR
jgi:hypothetical protein